MRVCTKVITPIFKIQNPVLHNVVNLTEWSLDMSSFTTQSGNATSHVSMANKQFRIVDVSDTCIKQRSLIQSLTTEEINAIEIQNVFGATSLTFSSSRT